MVGSRGIAKTSTRDLLIKSLEEEWPLTIKQIYERVKKQAERSLSYQALHKSVLNLESEGILEKVSGKYKISKGYISRLEKECLSLKQAYSEQKPVPREESKQLLFDNMIDLGHFILFEFINYPKSKEFPVVCHWNKMYSLIGLSRRDVKELEKSAKEKRILVLCRGTSLVDSLLSRAVKKMGIQAKLGVPVAFNCDLFVVGDHIMEIYFNPEHKKVWGKIWRAPVKVSDFDLGKTLNTMFSKNSTSVIIRKNPEVAKQIREQTLKEFRAKTRLMTF